MDLKALNLNGKNMSPFVSKAQARKFRERLANGEITQAAFDEWDAETNYAKLPERIGPPKKRPKPKGPRRLGNYR